MKDNFRNPEINNSKSVVLKIIRLDKELPVPKFAHPGDAGFDIFASEKTVIASGERVQVKTGFKLEIPEGYVGLIWDKSGLSQKSGLKTLGGVVDSGYRGELLVGVVNLSSELYLFEKGHKIAQMIIQKVEHVNFVEVEELSNTLRGESGFGSTGK